jgi:hypothetical protein
MLSFSSNVTSVTPALIAPTFIIFRDLILLVRPITQQNLFDLPKEAIYHLFSSRFQLNHKQKLMSISKYVIAKQYYIKLF